MTRPEPSYNYPPHAFSMKLYPEEKELLKMKSAKVGMTRASFIRKLIREVEVEVENGKLKLFFSPINSTT